MNWVRLSYGAIIWFVLYFLCGVILAVFRIYEFPALVLTLGIWIMNIFPPLLAVLVIERRWGWFSGLGGCASWYVAKRISTYIYFHGDFGSVSFWEPFLVALISAIMGALIYGAFNAFCSWW